MTPVDRRGALMSAARALFAERPYERVTTTEIARTAGVAYGLIAHHFENKRGLYLAVMRQVAAELAAAGDAVPAGGEPLEQLTVALTAHVHYIDRHSSGFVAMMRGGMGADPELRALFDEMRWNGVARILRRIGIDEPSGVMRAAMRGWAAYFDEVMLDRIENGDNDIRIVVTLASAQLVTALRTALRLDPDTGVAPALVVALSTAAC